MSARSFRIAQLLARLAVEVAWLSAWSAVLGYWLDAQSGPALPLVLLLGYILAASALARVASRGAEARWTRVAISVLGVLAAVGGGLLVAGVVFWRADLAPLRESAVNSRAFVAGCLAIVAWWRGSRLGVNRPNLYEVEGQFRFGILALAGVLALIAVIGPGASPDPLTLVEPALALVAAGLLGVPLARIAEVSAGSRSESPKLTPGGPWLGTLLGVVGGLLLVTLLLAGFVTVERAGVVLGILLAAVARVLGQIIMILAVPAGYLVEWLVNLLKSTATGQPQEPTITQQPPLDELLRQSQGKGGLPPEYELILQVILVLGILGIVVLILARAIARRQSWASEPDGVEELRDSVFGWQVIRELLDWVLGRLRRRRGSVQPDVSPTSGDDVEPRSIREVYREFLRLTARLGFPRVRAETPIEYARRLEREQLGEASGDTPGAAQSRGELEALTASYVRTRYGPPAPSLADVGPAARALERLRALWTRRG